LVGWAQNRKLQPLKHHSNAVSTCKHKLAAPNSCIYHCSNGYAALPQHPLAAWLVCQLAAGQDICETLHDWPGRPDLPHCWPLLLTCVDSLEGQPISLLVVSSFSGLLINNSLLLMCECVVAACLFTAGVTNFRLVWLERKIHVETTNASSFGPLARFVNLVSWLAKWSAGK